jgi:adenylate kinase family enzyme
LLFAPSDRLLNADSRKLIAAVQLTRFPRRIAVTGTSGSGKTTVARRIAAMSRLAHVELDALHWEPGWTPAEPEVFRRRVADALAGDAWVVDGGYAQVRDLTWGGAEHMIWLDYSMPRALWQVTVRTFRRRIKGAPADVLL